MLGWFRTSYGLKDTSDKLPPGMRRAITLPVLLLLLPAALVLAVAAAWLLSDPTDRAVTREALEAAAGQVRVEMAREGPEAARKLASELVIGADVEAGGQTARGSMTTVPRGSAVQLRCRVEWAGEAPAYAGTRLVVTNRRGGELATLTVQDLSAGEWAIEEAGKWLFWR